MNSRILLKTKNQIVLDEGDGYRIRATAQMIGTFVIIAIDWEHPNYGYFADGMLCFRSLHLNSWNAMPIANWCWKYKSNGNDENSEFLIKEFLKDYPELKNFFDLETSIWDNLSYWSLLEHEK